MTKGIPGQPCACRGNGADETARGSAENFTGESTGGTLIPAFFVLASHWSPPTGVDVDVAKHLDMVDTIAIATVVTHWTAVLTAAIGCLVVMVMKGPAYVADRYDLKDSDRPLAPRDRAKDGD